MDFLVVDCINMATVEACHKNVEIPRVPFNELDVETFQKCYFKPAKPVVITGMTQNWKCRQWTINNLMERVGDNEVLIRGKTNLEDYRYLHAYIWKKYYEFH